MNPLDSIVNRLQQALPGATFRDYGVPANKEQGLWGVSLSYQGKEVGVEYRPNYGYGVYLDQDYVYGQGPDHVTDCEDTALGLLLEFLNN